MGRCLRDGGGGKEGRGEERGGERVGWGGEVAGVGEEEVVVVVVVVEEEEEGGGGGEGETETSSWLS